MKRQNSLVLLASAMLVAMTLASCKSSNKPAAYPIGFAVTKDYLERTGLKFAEGATDTGVIVSWNTEGVANKDAKNVTLAPDGLSINPINWKRDDTYAPAKDNLGSLNGAQVGVFNIARKRPKGWQVGPSL